MIIGSGNVAGTVTNTGTLTIQNGGTVTADTGATSVGSKNGSSITVTGAGSTLQVAADRLGFPRRQGSAGRRLRPGHPAGRSEASVNAAGANIIVGGGVLGTAFDAATLTVSNGGTVTANNVTVNQGGTLNGNGGTINGNVTLNGGTLAPGASPGIMDINGNLNLTSGILNLEISTLLSDLLNVTGNVTFGAGLAINLIFDFAPPSGQIYKLEDFFAGYTALFFEPAFDLEAQLNSSDCPIGSYITASLGGESVPSASRRPARCRSRRRLALFGFGLLGFGAIRRRRAA